MQPGAPFRRQVLCCAVCLCLAGCGRWGDSAEESVEETDAFTEAIEIPAGGTSTANSPTETAAAPAGRPAERPAPLTLVKTVVQQLGQKTPQGRVSSRSVLEMTMTITPEESDGPPAKERLADSSTGQIPYRVRYQRVRLLRELPDQPQLNYDSDAASDLVPPAARPYQGLKDNGFRFRLNREYQLTGVADLEPFLDRCLQSIPPAQRQQFRAGLPLNSPADVIAWFVDDAIGLIPPMVSKAGDSWLRSREILQPVPIVITTRCTIRQMTAESADVDMAGTLGPAADRPGADLSSIGGGRMIVRGGKLLGRCRLDRRTGLPVYSHSEQSLEMAVQLVDGTELEQFKTTVTTLEPRTGEASPFPPPSAVSQTESRMSPR